MILSFFLSFFLSLSYQSLLLLGPKALSLKCCCFFFFRRVELLIGSRPHDTFFVV